MVTIKEVANYAGVSTATVSRVLRNIGYIGQDTYDKVHKAVKDLGYVVNSTARQLKCSPSKSVGFIISDINNEYYFSILPSIQKMLFEQGINLVIAFSSETPEHETQSFQTLIASRVSTILFTPVCDTNLNIINLAIRNGIKVIQLFRDIYPGIDSIINDDESGCRMATEKLIADGCKRIMLVDVAYGFLKFSDVNPNRSRSFTQVVSQHKNMQSHIINLPLINYDKEVLKNSIIEFNPDGIISATNIFGLEVLSVLKEKKNIKLITFDDNKWLELYGVTAIKQNISELTKQIELIIDDTEDTAKKIKIAQELVIR